MWGADCIGCREKTKKKYGKSLTEEEMNGNMG